MIPVDTTSLCQYNNFKTRTFVRKEKIMKDVEKPIKELLDDLFMEDVIFSYIVNDSKNIKGLRLTKFMANVDDNEIVTIFCDNIEMVYPANEILKVNEDYNNLVIETTNGAHIEISKV
jgi:hypothetical protein